MIAPQTAIAPNRMKRTVSIAPLLLQQRVDREDELLPGVVRGGEPPGVHPDRVARARLHAHAAEDAPEHVDVEPDRVFLHARGSPVLPLHQPMPARNRGGISRRTSGYSIVLIPSWRTMLERRCPIVTPSPFTISTRYSDSGNDISRGRATFFTPIVIAPVPASTFPEGA